MRICIAGPGRSGKSTAAKFLSEVTPLRYVGGTSFCFRELVFRRMVTLGTPYADPDDCYENRHGNRELWAEIIRRFVESDPPAKYRWCFDHYDQSILEGIRRKDELLACRDAGLFQTVIWI